MDARIRIALLLSGLAGLLLAAGLFLQIGALTAFWPVPAGRMSYIFVAAIIAAMGTPAIWIALVQERRALAGGALDLAVMSGGFMTAGAWYFVATGSRGMLLFGLAATAFLVLFVFVYQRGQAVPFRDLRPTPVPVRIAFGLFAAILSLAASALILQRPNTFPWPLSPENSVLSGIILGGSMTYFLYGLVYPVWHNACGQLLAFLTYDLVLIPPFLGHFAVVKPEMLLSLIIYMTVLVVSGLLAIYYLFLHPGTRFRRGDGGS